jgi:hypothetical protein
MKVQHDGEGKIFTIDKQFLFEVSVHDGDAIAKIVNGLIECSVQTPQVDELQQLAHQWERQADACNDVRYYGLGDDLEKLALLNRAKALETCARELRDRVARIKNGCSED